MKEPSTKCHKAWVFLSMALAALCAIYATYTQVSHKRLRVKYDRAIAQGESLEKDLERQREQTELRQRDYLRVLDLLEAIDSAKKYEKMQQIHDGAMDNQVDTPTLDKYFTAESKGKSAMDNFDSNEFDMLKAEEEYERIMEAEEDENSYKRELLARMFGGKLTSR